MFSSVFTITINNSFHDKIKLFARRMIKIKERECTVVALNFVLASPSDDRRSNLNRSNVWLRESPIVLFSYDRDNGELSFSRFITINIFLKITAKLIRHF